jgi:iron uptake system EfeUOB component EfeO/EfeM
VGLRRQRRRLPEAVRAAHPALEAKDAALTSEIVAGFAAVDKSLAEYANPDGSFDPYTALQAADKTRM